MKKLFTLLFTFGSLTSVFAQYNNDNRSGRSERNESNTTYESKNNSGSYTRPSATTEVYGRGNDKREFASNDHRYNDAFSMNSRERDFRTQKVNRDYDSRINSFSANRYMSFRERNFQIQALQRQKYIELRNIENCYSDSRNRYYDGHSNRW